MKKRTLDGHKNIFVYRNLGLILVFAAIIPSVALKGILRVIITLSILAIAYFFLSKFRCPYCNHIFNPRINKIDYCDKCGKKINNNKSM